MRIKTILVFALIMFFVGCTTTKNTPATPAVQRVPATFDFSPPSRVAAGSTGLTIAIVKPVYITKNAEYLVSPYKEMSEKMGGDFEELLTAKGFTVRGPFGSRDEMVFNDKVNSNFVIEINIALDQTWQQKFASKPNWNSILNTSQSTSLQTTSGQISLSGKLVINARSSKYGELLWKKDITLEPHTFLYKGSKVWQFYPKAADELERDDQVYNTVSRELEKYYLTSMNLAWQQIDPAEMKTIAAQGKKADAKE